MDKFGVLKLLSSLFDAYKQKGEHSSNANANAFDVESLLSPLKNLIGGGSNQKEQSPTTLSTQKDQLVNNKTFKPLQNKMLSTMNSHDQIVNRVKNNANKNITVK